MTIAPGLIVVGVHGTPSSDAALAFAIDEASRSHDALQLVTAWDAGTTLTSLDPAYGMVMSQDEHQAREAARQCQQACLERIRSGRSQPLDVSTRVVRGRPGPVLVEAARAARLLVIGRCSPRPVRELIRGSVGGYCTRRAGAPLIVVPWADADAAPALRETAAAVGNQVTVPDDE